MKPAKNEREREEIKPFSGFVMVKLSKLVPVIFVLGVLVYLCIVYFPNNYDNTEYRLSMEQWRKTDYQPHSINDSLHIRLELEDKVEMMLEKASEQALTERFNGADDKNVLPSSPSTVAPSSTTIEATTKSPASPALKRRLEVDDEVELLLEKSSEQVTLGVALQIMLFMGFNLMTAIMVHHS